MVWPVCVNILSVKLQKRDYPSMQWIGLDLGLYRECYTISARSLIYIIIRGF